ncbi:SRPBCC family protein [Rhizomicrobium electricum]|uniref:SRPBCC family protein n=1 Tax=Rhizomicrobium electricum TaxID=480070 RepID=A0ABN1FAF8_9PROT|nr:SRPBCC domain-containing protein [Rhizomicrobium electricum]NIJ50569.1 uncharacterized protein YndB with AHSA1/START domain [Rhizomicrobium electricum]
MDRSFEFAPTFELTLARAIPAPPATVFDAWLDPKKPGGPWFGVKALVLDPVPGGLFYHAVTFEGREWAHYGRFLVIDRPKKIEHTWVSAATRGLESVLTLTFAAEGEGTLLTLHHAGLPDDAMGRRHEEGWRLGLDGLHDDYQL